MFCDITWGAGGSTADLTLDIATKMQNMVRGPTRRSRRAFLRPCAAAANTPLTARWRASQMCVETMMHLTCTNMPRESLKAALDKARAPVVLVLFPVLTLVSAPLACAGQV